MMACLHVCDSLRHLMVTEISDAFICIKTNMCRPNTLELAKESDCP